MLPLLWLLHLCITSESVLFPSFIFSIESSSFHNFLSVYQICFSFNASQVRDEYLWSDYPNFYHHSSEFHCLCFPYPTCVSSSSSAVWRLTTNFCLHTDASFIFGLQSVLEWACLALTHRIKLSRTGTIQFQDILKKKNLYSNLNLIFLIPQFQALEKKSSVALFHQSAFCYPQV